VTPSPVHPQQALAVYAEPLAAGRRVVVFADPATGLLERFEALEAEVVVLLGPDDDLDELRGARFDLALVADLALFEDAEALLARVRRLVGDAGVAIVAAANREAGEGRAFDYYALFDLVAREFADVRMIAELPFHGLALAEVGDEDEAPSVSVDTQLADGQRAPVAFVAVASQRGASLDPYAIIELPAPDHAPERVVQDTRALDDARAELAEERLRSQALAAHAEATQAQASAQAARAVELERQLAARARQLADLSTEVEEVRSAAEAGRIAAAQVEELARRADRAEKALALAEPEAARAAEAHTAELAAFERVLRDRAQAIRQLEMEVARREQMVRELVTALEEHAERPIPSGPTPPAGEVTAPAGEVTAVAEPGPQVAEALAALTEENARLQQKLDALALDLARREGEAQACAWTIAELERRVAQASASPAAAPAAHPPASDLQRRLGEALDELDALRQALAQEHEARARAESGEELTHARAEIQRQAALLEQLGQKLQTSSGTEELR
jgi:hypothetical protein